MFNELHNYFCLHFSVIASYIVTIAIGALGIIATAVGYSSYGGKNGKFIVSDLSPVHIRKIYVLDMFILKLNSLELWYKFYHGV